MKALTRKNQNLINILNLLKFNRYNIDTNDSKFSSHEESLKQKIICLLKRLFGNYDQLPKTNNTNINHC